jgi:fido (protein-threonine AMPylation protein)
MPFDPYVYPRTDVLRNRYGLRDPSELTLREAATAALRLAELVVRPVSGRYDLPHLQAIHRRLFGDIYEWAGELRTVALAKPGAMFALPEHIEAYLTGMFAELHREQQLRGLDRNQLPARLAHYLAEINAAHPFREGNGRAQRAFIGQLAAERGYRIAWDRLDPNRNLHASGASLAGNERPLRELIDDLLDDLDQP